jgi:hypothetical protein
VTECPCGLAHVVPQPTRDIVDALVASFGETVRVTTPDGAWAVPRAFIAYHGLAAAELPALAAAYGWERA